MSAILIERKERRGAAVAEAENLIRTADAENRTLTDEEQKRYDALLVEADQLEAEIERREKLEKAKRATAKPERVDPTQRIEAEDAQVARVYPMARRGALRSFKGAKAEEQAYRSGMWLRAILYGDTVARNWCQDHGLSFRALEEGVNTKGGFVVPDDMMGAIIDLRESYGVFRRYAKVETMSRDHQPFPRRTGGVTAYAIGENAAITESDKGWDNVTLTAKKWGVLTKYSSELAEDATISIADDLAQEIAYAFASKEDACAFNGDGTATYHGIVGILTKMVDGNHAGSYTLAPGAGDTMDMWTEISDAALCQLMGALPGYALQRNPKWYCPVGAVHNVFGRLLRAGGGNTQGSLAAGAPVTQYAGYEVVPVAAWTGTPTTDLTGLIMILFGDMSLAAKLGDRRGVAIRVSSDRYLEFDQLAIVGTTRFDINIHDIGDSSNPGPLVGLRGN